MLKLSRKNIRELELLASEPNIGLRDRAIVNSIKNNLSRGYGATETQLKRLEGIANGLGFVFSTQR